MNCFVLFWLETHCVADDDLNSSSAFTSEALGLKADTPSPRPESNKVKGSEITRILGLGPQRVSRIGYKPQERRWLSLESSMEEQPLGDSRARGEASARSGKQERTGLKACRELSLWRHSFEWRGRKAREPRDGKGAKTIQEEHNASHVCNFKLACLLFLFFSK